MKHSVEEIKLRNGARGLLIDIPGASVMSTRVQFRAGMLYAKSKDVYEIPHVVEHLAFGANAKFKDEQAFEAEFTKNGAYHNAWTSDISVCYETECADFEWERIMDLQRVSICEPRFNEEELKSEKANVRSELTGYMNDYYRLLWPRVQQAVGEDILDLSERIKTLPNIELKDIREHYRRTHTAKNMMFIIAGKLRGRKRTIIKMLEDWELKEGREFEIPLADLHSSEAVSIRRKDASNITFGFSLVTPRHLETKEVFAMNCLNQILNGTTNSRIFGTARKRGLVYGMGSSVASNAHNSYWDFDGEVNNENAEELFELIQTELMRALNGEILDMDFLAAKSYALGRFQMGAQTPSQIADYYAEGYFTNGTIERYDNMPNLIKSIDKFDMIELAREFAGSGIKGFAAVSSAEKAFISQLETRLNF
ncbi:insulinase family protein [Candidatus Saccharibacteria bacterium]|nr:insulinase family protein [Candidatus Saccharibacteria bacterium]MBR3121893.1 insulinase family protein [Candidatus Saccharibacteria bacterium]